MHSQTFARGVRRVDHLGGGIEVLREWTMQWSRRPGPDDKRTLPLAEGKVYLDRIATNFSPPTC